MADEFARAHNALITAAATLAALADVTRWIATERLAADGKLRAALHAQIGKVILQLEHTREDVGEQAELDRDQIAIDFCRRALEVSR